MQPETMLLYLQCSDGKTPALPASKVKPDLMSHCTGADLVVHTAGPFQRKERCAVLEAALATKVGRVMPAPKVLTHCFEAGRFVLCDVLYTVM